MSAPPARKDATTRGQVDGVAAGNAGIQAAYSGYNYYWNGYSCLNSPVNGQGSATMNMCDSGVPDHLQVEADTNGTRPNCPTVVSRQINFYVLDYAGTILYYTPSSEHFVSVSHNTCGNGQPLPSSCQTDFSLIVDTITVNCNTVGGSCGYAITDDWQWCPSGSAAVILGTLNETVHSNQITVDGVSTPNKIPAGTNIYAQ
jgi:hypothetical protein